VGNRVSLTSAVDGQPSPRSGDAPRTAIPSAQEGSPMSARRQPRNDKSFTLCSNAWDNAEEWGLAAEGA
jgi:hypothetical protein